MHVLKWLRYYGRLVPRCKERILWSMRLFKLVLRIVLKCCMQTNDMKIAIELLMRSWSFYTSFFYFTWRFLLRVLLIVTNSKVQTKHGANFFGRNGSDFESKSLRIWRVRLITLLRVPSKFLFKIWRQN
jgi:hypothetical protein